MDHHDALQRAMKYCAGAEHCTYDVLQKLHEWGVSGEVSEHIMQQLGNEKFVDDSRYAKSYVSEKWNLNKWGKGKIRYMLEAKMIDVHLILDALDSISEEQYLNTMDEILHSKWRELKYVTDPTTIQKVVAFGAGRGFEEELLQEWAAKNGFEYE